MTAAAAAVGVAVVGVVGAVVDVVVVTGAHGSTAAWNVTGPAMGNGAPWRPQMPWMVAKLSLLPPLNGDVSAPASRIIAWLGPAIEEDIEMGSVEERRKRRWSHDNVFSTLLGFFEAATDSYVPNMDILGRTEKQISGLPAQGDPVKSN